MRPLLHALLLLSSISCFAQEVQDWSDEIEVINEKLLNSEFSEFSPNYFNDKLIYVKNRTRQKLLDKKNNEPYFDLFYASKGKAGFLSAGESLGTTVNTTYHEGPASIAISTGTMYFTRVDYDGSEFKLNKDKVAQLKIFETKFEYGNWTKPQKSVFNKANEASCHPAISQDGETLIFASDREGGYGKMDLYVSQLIAGKWSEPKNLGPEINTKENDWFPYINERDWLVFATEGRKKNRGLDLVISRKSNIEWEEPVLLPYPINTNYDDFGFVMSNSAKEGYFSSNRPGGAGKDDIYSFNSLKQLYLLADSSYNLLSLKIQDKKTNDPIKDAIVKYGRLKNSELLNFDSKIFDEKSHHFLDSLHSDETGLAEMRLPEGYSVISINSPGKNTWHKVIYNQGGQQNFTVNLENKLIANAIEPKIIYVEKIIERPQKINNVKVDVGAVIVLENIYYDYNSYELTQGAKTELNQLVQLMQNNPNLKIQLSAHTDSRGKKQYNLELSQKRAQSAKAYLLSKGLIAENIIAKGYGESQLRNHCADNINCSEAEHIYNRRTEVKILDK